MAAPGNLLLGWLGDRASQLRFPTLFLLVAALFVLDVIIPDIIPFADEILLGLVTALLGSWRRRRPEPPAADAARTIDVEPVSDPPPGRDPR